MATDEPLSRSGEHNHKLLTYRVDRHEDALREIRDAVKAIEKCLQVLSSVEERNIRTNLQLAELTKTIRAIEVEMPTMRLVRGWVLAAMTTGGAAVGAGVLALVVR